MLLRELYTWREAQDLRSTLSHGKLNMALGLLRWEFLFFLKLSCHVNVFFVLVLTVRCGNVPFPPTQNSHREKTHGTWCLSAGNYLVRGACFCDLENILTRTLRRDKEKPIHTQWDSTLASLHFATVCITLLFFHRETLQKSFLAALEECCSFGRLARLGRSLVTFAEWCCWCCWCCCWCCSLLLCCLTGLLISWQLRSVIPKEPQTPYQQEVDNRGLSPLSLLIFFLNGRGGGGREAEVFKNPK